MKFVVINISTESLTNIQISCTGCDNIETLEFDNKNKIEYRLDMSSIPKTDGSYNIEFNRNGEKENQHFGYYTNGYPINNNFEIAILEDTIEIREQ